MNAFFRLVLLASALSGCAHQDLRAPCAAVASLTSGSIPCDQREPVNAALIPTTFAP